MGQPLKYREKLQFMATATQSKKARAAAKKAKVPISEWLRQTVAAALKK